MSRKVCTLNADEESEVSQARLPVSLPTGPHNLPDWLGVIAMGMGYPVHDSRKQLPGNDLQTPV